MTAPAARSALTRHSAAVQELARRWLAQVAADPRTRGDGGLGDFACSPVGLWLALTAVAAGARGLTARELRAVLGGAGPAATESVTEVSRALAETDALAVATGVWSAVPVHRAFREALPDLGFGQLRPGETAPIDAWVRKATGGLVPRLPLTPTRETVLLLVNALALKARWEHPFEPDATRPRAFTDAAGTTHQVETMVRDVSAADVWSVPLDAAGPPEDRRPGERRAASDQADRAAAAERAGHRPRPRLSGWARAAWSGRGLRNRGGAGAETTGGGQRVTVAELRCRPGADGGPPALVRLVLGPPGAAATQVLPAAWLGPSARTPVEASRVTLALPRLALRTRLDVAPHLAALGVRAALGDEAEFPHLAPEPLRIEQVAQESVVRIAEQGVEAASVTAVAMAFAGAALPAPEPLRIAFDRPFGIVVLDPGGTVPLCTAWQASAPRGPEPAEPR